MYPDQPAGTAAPSSFGLALPPICLARSISVAAPAIGKVIRAQILQIQLTLKADEVALTYTQIDAPIRGLIDDGAEPSEIAILVSKQQNLYCQRLTAAFDADEIPFHEEDKEQDLASEPVASLLIDFLLIASGARQPATYRRLLDFVVFDHGYDEEREYQLRSRWDRFVTEAKRQIAAHEIDLRQINDLQVLATALVNAVGRDNLIALSPDYSHGDRLDKLINQALERAHMLLQGDANPATTLACFSGDSAVRIMSVHKSKGLEFDTVVILGVENETFWGEPSAERAAYFVGISRAKQRLFLRTMIGIKT